MPFTISHTAAVLPWTRSLARWHLLSASVIGSMVPDFHFFFRHMARAESHSAASLLTFSLPVGLLCYWIFQRLVKVAMVELLPEGAYARWQADRLPAALGSIKQWLVAACGIVAGAITHLVWDAFTHEGARGVRMIPMLDELMFDVGQHHLAGARLWQDGSSLLGLIAAIAIIAYGLRRGRETPIPNRPLPARERHLWAAFYVLSIALSSLVCYGLAQWNAPGTHSLVIFASGVAIAILRGAAAGLCCASVVVLLRLRALRGRSARLRSHAV